MFSLRTLVAAVPLLALAYAQSTKVAFTSLPASLSAGDSFNITWAGGDGSPVSLTLRRGNPSDLDTVSTIAGNVDGYWYNWIVPQTIETGADYALQIVQGQSDINWTGLFSIRGAAVSSSNSTSATTASASGNSTMRITSAASASGTGTAMNRNTTFSTASLTSSGESGAFTFASASSTTHASTSRTSAAASSGTSGTSNDATAMAGSSAAMILGIVAAVMLN